ncbi:MAG: LLM class F420-dependent oxidoreductase [Dehalococcoidia bacterium]|jgi:F420-dependent oxidoreductase-like protein|nr:LLM class F420-dependent oxidoreductase [Dehalococcoidia bacterium]
MDLGVMIEGQDGLSWDLWRRLIRATEDLGYESLWRSDHFFPFAEPREREALETFISFVLVAEESSRIRFGPMVASATFRHPSLLARMAAQIDVLSGGRFICGIGAGWNVPEHESFGLPFPSVGERIDRLDEQIRVLKALWADEPANFEGKHFQLKDAVCYPKPIQQPLPMLVGGGGEKRTLRIVAEHADEWNFVGGDLDTYNHKREVLEQHCADVGRDPAEIRHSQMAGFVIGKDDAAVSAHADEIKARNPVFAGTSTGELLDRLRTRGGWLVGTPGEVVEEMGRREQAGLTCLQLQHHSQENFEVLELIASEVLPQVQD